MLLRQKRKYQLLESKLVQLVMRAQTKQQWYRLVFITIVIAVSLIFFHPLNFLIRTQSLAKVLKDTTNIGIIDDQTKI